VCFSPQALVRSVPAERYRRSVATRVLLIGLMGCGKTTVGRRVARELDVPYVDNDASIAALAGMTTVELANQGGTVLHDLEARYAISLLERAAPFVAGVAASTADRPDELAALDDGGLLVYLRCPPDVLIARVAAGPPRPWLPPDPTALITSMYEARDPILRTCRLVVDGADPAGAVVERIKAELAAGFTP
jgi:shikimate kinase